MASAVVAAFTLLAAVFHSLSQSQRHLWADEASTYWTIQARVTDILRGARTDGTPPLYFLIVSAASHVFGASELALRLPSILAATALVPASYVVTRFLATRRAALAAAALAAISPLVHYYAVEARSYAVLQVETLAVLYFTCRAMLAARQLKWWVLLSVSQALQLLTHNYSLFLLSVPALVSLLVSERPRLAVAARATASAIVALLIYLPWFFRARESAAAGVGDWIRRFWESTPPSAAIVRSLEAFGFGGRYPDYLTYLAIAPVVRVLALPLLAGLLAIAVFGPVAKGASGPGQRGRAVTLLAFLFVPLIGAWLYSWLRDPLYLVGRYDTIVLPIFLILCAIGLDALTDVRPWIGGTVAAMVTVLAVLSSWPALGPPLDSDVEDVMAAHYLTEHTLPGDVVVFTGLRRPVVAYYLVRAGRETTMMSFPAEMAEHPGWFSEEKMLGDRTRLARDGEALAEMLAIAAGQGHAVWFLASGVNGVDAYLDVPLLRRLAIDEPRSIVKWHLYSLKPRYGAEGAGTPST